MTKTIIHQPLVVYDGVMRQPPCIRLEATLVGVGVAESDGVYLWGFTISNSTDIINRRVFLSNVNELDRASLALA